MNGRVYDPMIGRFMSVDPVFQFPENTQSLNPYSYVLNNPLSFTDPSGLCLAETGTHISGGCAELTQVMKDGSRIFLGSFNPGNKNEVDHFKQVGFPGMKMASAPKAAVASNGAKRDTAAKPPATGTTGADQQERENAPPIAAQAKQPSTPTPVSSVDKARTVFGETEGLFPQLDTSKMPESGFRADDVYRDKYYDEASAAQLAKARIDVAKVRERNSKVRQADAPPPSDRIKSAQWSRAEAAAADAATSDLPDNVRHFVLRQGPEYTERVKQAPWVKDLQDRGIKPYRTYGPFQNVGGGDVPPGPDTYIDFYQGVK